MKYLTIVVYAIVYLACIKSSLSSCGISKVIDSYTESVEAKVGAFPWSAFILYADKKVKCNAILIDKRHVLADYSCVQHSLNPISIGLGGHDVTSVEIGECVDSTCPDGITLLFGIENLISHPVFRETEEIYHNIAVVRLDKDVVFTDNIRPICLPSDIENLPELKQGDKVITAGWGKKFSNETPGKILQAIVGIASNCSDIYDEIFDLSEAEFCTTVEKDGDPDICSGFTGSPVMRKNGEKWVLYGLVKLGKGCSSSSSQSVIYKALFYNDWIKSVI